VTSGASIDQPFLMHKHQSQKPFDFWRKNYTRICLEKWQETTAENAGVQKTQQIK